MQPRIIFVGRPNVGKSTLFNRLLRQRRAIVDPTAGVTRDLIEKNALLADRKVILVDTGGMEQDKKNGLDLLVQLKSRRSLDEAAVIVFIVEAHGITGADENIADLLRSYRDRVLLVVNKAESILSKPDYDAEISDFYSLGLGDPIPLSAEHNRNIENVIHRIVELCPETDEATPYQPPSLRLAIVGRPNVGKSSLLNTITKTDYAIVFDRPGTTRDSLDFTFTYNGRPIVITDTAGMRRKSRVRNSLEYYSVNRAVKSIEASDVVVVIIPVDEPISEQDKHILKLAARRRKSVVIAINKWDILQEQGEANARGFIETLRYNLKMSTHIPIVPLSALRGYNIKKLMKTVFNVHEQYYRRIDTAPLNTALQRIIAIRPPEFHGGKKRGQGKFFYLTQVDVAPPEFIAFVNDPEKISKNYTTYIINALRKEFGFTGCPLILTLKGRTLKDRLHKRQRKGVMS